MMMYGCRYSLLLLGLTILLSTTLQMSAFRVNKDKNCPDTPRPVNKSIKACWDYTRKLETVLIEKTDVKTDICLDVVKDFDNHEFGVEMMRTSKIIYCFGSFKHGDFAKEDFTYNINGMEMRKSEIMENPDICVGTGDYTELNCMTDIEYSDYNVLYKAVVEQLRLLEGLFIGTNDGF